jgi:glucans biosynthesis protein
MSGGRARSNDALRASPRCGAKTRSGGSCRAPAVHGKARCRMHGGAARSGAPWGNRNARKHGLFAKAAVAERRQITTLLGEVQKLLDEMKPQHLVVRSTS